MLLAPKGQTFPLGLHSPEAYPFSSLVPVCPDPSSLWDCIILSLMAQPICFLESNFQILKTPAISAITVQTIPDHS